jgi:hypothetical protein
VLVAVYWVNRAVGLFDQLIGDGQSALVFLEFSLADAAECHPAGAAGGGLCGLRSMLPTG